MHSFLPPLSAGGGDFFPKNFPKGGAKFFAKNTKGPIIFSGLRSQIVPLSFFPRVSLNRNTPFYEKFGLGTYFFDTF